MATERLANVPTPGGTSAESPQTISTAAGSTPSSSAAICANVVSCPWPCGEEPVRTVTRPSGSTRISALSQRPPARSTYMPTPMPTTLPSARARSRSSRRRSISPSSSAASRQRSKLPESYVQPSGVS